MAIGTVDDRIVNLDELDSERRKSFRMASFDETKSAKMKVGSKIVVVDIIDESAGGFLVECEDLPNLKPTNHVELFTHGGAHLLRVAWRRNVDGNTRLGLQRLCQAPPKQGSPWIIWLLAAAAIGIGVGLVAINGGFGS